MAFFGRRVTSFYRYEGQKFAAAPLTLRVSGWGISTIAMTDTSPTIVARSDCCSVTFTLFSLASRRRSHYRTRLTTNICRSPSSRNDPYRYLSCGATSGRRPVWCGGGLKGASAASTACNTRAGCNSSRHLLKLPMCRSHPSFWQGRQGKGCCTSQTFLRRWIVPVASHMGSSPPAGTGPHSRGSVGPNSAMVGHPVAAAR